MKSNVHNRAGLSGQPGAGVPVGREREQDILASALESTRAGAGGVVVITGEAGIGKTTMLQWALECAHSLNATAFSAQCLDVVSPPPYGPWLSIVRQIRTVSDGDESIPELNTIESREALWELVHRAVFRLASDRPIVITIEDVHWADEPSLDLLSHLVRDLQTHPALFIVTYRDDDVSEDHRLPRTITDIVRTTRTWRMHLQRLDRRGAHLLVQQLSRLPEEDEVRLVDHLMERSDGNPFFAVEVLQMLVERQYLNLGEETSLADVLDPDSVPPLVHHVISRRFSSFPDETRNMLELASVIGNEVPLTLLEQIYTGTLIELDTALQSATVRGALRESESIQSVRFGHELFRQSIYATITPLRRRRLHRQIGEALVKSRHPNPDLVAEHLARAGDERALEWMVHAASRAQQLHAPDLARDRCRHAIDFARSVGVDPPVAAYRVLGAALDTLGDIDGALENLNAALELATRLQNQRERWTTLLELSKIWSSNDYRQTLRFVNEALQEAQRIGDQTLIAASRNQLGNCYANIEQFDRAIEAHTAALAIFESLNDQHGIASTRDLIGLAHVLSGDAARAVTEYERAIPVLRRLDERRTLITALVTSSVSTFGAEHILYSTSMEHRRPEYFHLRYAQIDEAREITTRIGWRAGEAFALALRSRIAHLSGDLDVALQNGRDGDEIARRIGHPQWRILALCSLGDLYLDVGDVTRALNCFRTANGLAEPTGSRFMSGLTRSFLASAHASAGTLEEADALLAPYLELSQPPATTSQLNLWVASIKLCIARNDTATALSRLEEVDRAIPGPPEHIHPAMRLLRARILHRDRRHDEAETILLAAEQIAERFRYLPLLLSIIVLRHQNLVALGNVNDATLLIERGTQLAGLLAERIAEVDPALAETFANQANAGLDRNVEVTTTWETGFGVEHLTPREREVLELVALGLTDAETADRLFISPRTVGQHLRSIYSKLDVSNRTRAIRVARQRNLIDDQSGQNSIQ